MIEPDRLAALVEWCVRSGRWFISDEIYHGLTYGCDATSALTVSDDLFVIKAETGKGLGHQLSVRLAKIGTAFAAARVVDMAKNGAYKEDKHAATLKRFPYAGWNSSERAMAPALVVDDLTQVIEERLQCGPRTRCVGRS